MEDSYTFPITTEGVRDFLAGPWATGIGSTYATRLTERFGTDAVRVLAENPAEAAAAVPGLGMSRAEGASESLRAVTAPLGLLIFLCSCGIGETYLDRILAKYRKRASEVVASDPYSMVEDVWQLSFFTADKIGRALGIPDGDPRRLTAALVTAVKRHAEQGHLFATPAEAVAEGARISGADAAAVEAQIASATESGRLVESRGGLYLPVFYKAEKEGAGRLAELSAVTRAEVPRDLIPSTDRLGHTYTPAQLDAIATALRGGVSVLTGGPGSGKTTVLKGVIEALAGMGKRVVLCAPTGRAAKRMSALTGHTATTIHSLLGYRQGEGYRRAGIEADVLIIDEGSMMEQVLFNHLLAALHHGTGVILVGDVDQLPAIGAGDVLRDLIDSGVVPVVRLSENFRQAAGSGIAAAARAINAGRLPEEDPREDFVIIEESGTARIRERIVALMSRELPEQRGLRPSDILVVTPQQIGPLGARVLNTELQRRLNPDAPGLTRGSVTLSLGDPVMQRTNSRARGVYNGETGRVTEVDPDAGTLGVEFSDGRRSTYTRTELGELTLAYATSVHKLQGSEARNIIFVVTSAHRPMLYRNLLYTGVSRATELCIIIGEPEALRHAIRNNPTRIRNSNFKQRLHSSFAARNLKFKV